MWRASKLVLISWMCYVFNPTLHLTPDEIHLILPQTSSRRRPGICVHNAKLEQGDMISWEGLKMTTVAQTIADVARSG